MTGYIIYYQQDGGERLSQSAGSTDTTATFTGLMIGATYSFTMMSTSSTLPSIETEAETITIGNINKIIILHIYMYNYWYDGKSMKTVIK